MITRLTTAVHRTCDALRAWSRDEEGLEAVEWVLVIAGGVAPLAAIVFKVMQTVVFYYEVMSWGVSLPFP